MILAVLGLILIVAGIITFTDRGAFLLFDTSKGLYSGRLTQGRSTMWIEVIGWYTRDYTLLGKFFGGGPGADQVMTQEIFVDSSLRGLDCHNLYLSLLVNYGITGLVLFFYFVWSVLLQYLRVVTQWRTNSVHDQYLCAFTGTAIVLFLSGLTNNSLIYAQLTWPFFYFAGTLFSDTNSADCLEIHEPD
jgi:O-antigen ligase